jgi:hypothetical protein
MRFPSDEEVLQEFRNKPDAVPRSEFLRELEKKLVTVDEKYRSKQKVRRTIARLGVSVAMLLAVFLLSPVFTRIITNPDAIMTTQPEAPPLVLKGQELKLEEISPAAKKTLEKLFQLVPELKTLESEVIGQEDGLYGIHFYPKGQEDEEEYITVEMMAATGKLSYFEIEEVKDAASPTEEQAKQYSSSFLQALLGDEFKRYQVSQTRANDWNTITYMRYENGLPVFSDRYVVGVNSKGVEYVNTFEGAPLHIPSTSYAKPGTILSEEEITEKVASLMELTYIAVEKNTGKPSMGYSLQTTGYLDAVTGEEVWSTSSHKSLYSDPISVTPGGKKVNVQTEEELAKALAEQFQVNLSGFDLTLEGRPPKEMKGEQSTNYKAKEGRGRVTVYTRDGVIRGFQVRRGVETAESTQHQNYPTNARFTYDEAREMAVQFLQPYLDKSVTELKIEQNKFMMPSATSYSFSFYALHQGVIVGDQQYLVNVDAQSGEIVNFMDYFASPTEPFPDLDKAMTKEEAAKQFLQSRPVTLGYVLPVVNEKVQQKPLLVYSVDRITGFMVNAITGKIY